MNSFQRNSFDLMYQMTVWSDAIKALTLKREEGRIDRVLHHLMRRALKLSNHELCFFSSGREAFASILSDFRNTDSQVLVAGFTCEVVPAYILKLGLKPVYYECSPFRRINLEHIKKRVTDKTLAVIVQHSFGIQEDITDLVAFCRRKKIIVIEDKALCFSSRKNDLPELQGDFAYYSFEASKSMTCRMGGLLVFHPSNSLSLSIPAPSKKKRVSSFLSDTRTFLAILVYCQTHTFFLFFRKFLILFGILGASIRPRDLSIAPPRAPSTLTNYQKKLLILQLLRLDRQKFYTRKLVKFWRSELGSLVDPIYCSDDCFPVRLPIRIDQADSARRDVRAAGMLDYHWFSSGVGSEYDASKLGFNSLSFPFSSEEASKIVNLPTIKKLPEERYRDICQALLKYRA